MSLSNFCCTLLKFYSQNCPGAICFPSVTAPSCCQGSWAGADVLSVSTSHLLGHDVNASRSRSHQKRS